ncbi:phospholipase domain-containing protein [Caulobacter segnis]
MTCGCWGRTASTAGSRARDAGVEVAVRAKGAMLLVTLANTGKAPRAVSLTSPEGLGVAPWRVTLAPYETHVRPVATRQGWYDLDRPPGRRGSLAARAWPVGWRRARTRSAIPLMGGAARLNL